MQRSKGPRFTYEITLVAERVPAASAAQADPKGDRGRAAARPGTVGLGNCAEANLVLAHSDAPSSALPGRKPRHLRAGKTLSRAACDAEKDDECTVYRQQGCSVEAADMLADAPRPDAVEQIDCRPGR